MSFIVDMLTGSLSRGDCQLVINTLLADTTTKKIHRVMTHFHGFITVTNPPKEFVSAKWDSLAILGSLECPVSGSDPLVLDD